MLFEAVGKEPNFFYAPLWLFDVIIDSLQWVSDTFKTEKFENAAELGRIGKYYAVEDIITTDPDEKFGTMTLQEHYNKIAVEGQEYDPYTTMCVWMTWKCIGLTCFVLYMEGRRNVRCSLLFVCVCG